MLRQRTHAPRLSQHRPRVKLQGRTHALSLNWPTVMLRDRTHAPIEFKPVAFQELCREIQRLR